MRSLLLAATFAVLCSSVVACSSSDSQPATSAVPTYAPVPSEALGPTISSDLGYRVQDLANGTYLISDGVYQSIFIVATDSVIMLDAPPTTGHNILRAIRTVTDLPISHLVYSHSHADHIGAAHLLVDQNVVVIAHEETTKLLMMTNDKARPLPNVTFSDTYQLNVSNQTVELSYKGSNHEPGNIFIYAPIPKVLMVVDLVYPRWVPFANLAESQNIPGWILAHDQILEYDFNYYSGGHVNVIGTRDDVQTQKEYITDLFNNCAEAIALTGLPANATNPLSFAAVLPAVEAANPGNSWATVKYGDDLLVDWCNNKTNTKWAALLAGTDVYGSSNAEVMLESLRIDYGILGAAGVQGA